MGKSNSSGNSSANSSTRTRTPNTKLKQAKKRTRQKPKTVGAWLDLGALHVQSQRWAEARSAFETAAELAPDSPDVHEWLGRIAYLQQDPDTALAHLAQAQKQRPDSVFALTTLTRVYLDRMAKALALDCARRAAALAPDNIDVMVQLARAAQQNQGFDEAIALFERLTELEPHKHGHWNNLGNVYRDLSLLDQANRCYRRATELAPAEPLPFSNWLTGLHYDPHADRDTISQLALEWQSRFAAPHPPARPVPADRAPDKRLRIGMLSDGFRQHPVGKMIVRCLENLSAADFELVAYSSSGARDQLTVRLEKLFSRWQPIRHLSDSDLAQRIRADEIDILIDMSGHHSGTRMRVMAMQPAPLLVKWVGGLINTTGVAAIDYLISDTVETPPGEDVFYSEKLIRMPGDYIVFDPPPYLPELGELPAKINGYVTLGCFNNPTKINDVVLAEWARIMHALADSRLMLKGHAYVHEDLCRRILTTFENHGIARERIILDGPSDNRDMLAAYNQVDIALDPWPYSGGLTTCEGFAMGVPVVTLPGPTFAGRHSATHLINAGMPELVVSSWEEYRARVIELARDLDNLATIRTLLRRTLLESPVCDGPGFARHFTNAMRAIWQRACADRAPAALSFDEQDRPRFEDEETPVALQHPVAQRSASDFDWQFNGRIIAIDNGGRFLNTNWAESFLQHDALELVVFDPAGQNAKSSRTRRAHVHYYPATALGDGEPATLHACLDPGYSSLLAPLEHDESSPREKQARRILARLPIDTVQLDAIDGLRTIDWLMLDDLNDSALILDHAKTALRDTLLVQVRVAFQPTHTHQPNLAELQHWAARQGLVFYRLHDADHRHGSPDEAGLPLTPTTLKAADALFLPGHERMQRLSANDRTKLAFILHTAFGIHDRPYALLAENDADTAARYLANVRSEPTDTAEDGTPPEHEIRLPDAPHMTEPERGLFKGALRGASRYFEFGSGGSTVWAVGENLDVHGVDSDAKWVEALKARLGERCRLVSVDIGPTGAWGYPTSAEHEDAYPRYSQAIFDYDEAFDLILVDGRFRVACTIAAIQHIMQRSAAIEAARIFIHDFWERPDYHRVLQFLEPVDRADSAGLFRIKPDVESETLSEVWSAYATVVK
ncbi:tetratricopeptide repeat protein [Salinisphaera sp.]|uniref:O-linked N-acetylglucosamine transferase, SPINDLY family protein n=1 Tax=Salinisphaera sp. TaxID=1914330 RepID=UPI002D79F42E|nr:tetratricopeptide repeat protein [Salinisphaera sp.]HET7313725.1 tetratricopeptide repeat protein [Salinisphaera sp.]